MIPKPHFLDSTSTVIVQRIKKQGRISRTNDRIKIAVHPQIFPSQIYVTALSVQANYVFVQEVSYCIYNCGILSRHYKNDLRMLMMKFFPVQTKKSVFHCSFVLVWMLVQIQTSHNRLFCAYQQYSWLFLKD